MNGQTEPCPHGHCWGCRSRPLAALQQSGVLGRRQENVELATVQGLSTSGPRLPAPR